MIREVRGKGLMIGIELVKSKESLEPMSVDKIRSMIKECREIRVCDGESIKESNEEI